MAGLDPATHLASVRERSSHRRADARLMDGRLKGGHDEFAYRSAFLTCSHRPPPHFRVLLSRAGEKVEETTNNCLAEEPANATRNCPEMFWEVPLSPRRTGHAGGGGTGKSPKIEKQFSCRAGPSPPRAKKAQNAKTISVRKSPMRSGLAEIAARTLPRRMPNFTLCGARGMTGGL